MIGVLRQAGQLSHLRTRRPILHSRCPRRTKVPDLDSWVCFWLGSFQEDASVIATVAASVSCLELSSRFSTKNQNVDILQICILDLSHVAAKPSFFQATVKAIKEGETGQMELFMVLFLPLLTSEPAEPSLLSGSSDPLVPASRRITPHLFYDT